MKFVASSKEDLMRMEKMIALFDLTLRTSVYVSPVFGSIEPAEIVDFMKERNLNKVTLQLQLHKIIWPECDRGV